MSSTFEITNTIGGSLVRIYSRDNGPNGGIHGAYLEQESGQWYIAAWQSNGHVHAPNDSGSQYKTLLDLECTREVMTA